MKEIKGMCPIVPTAYTDSGELDLDSIRNLLRTRAAAGADAFTLFGIAGEYYKQTDEETRILARAVSDECRSIGVPLVMSVTQHSDFAACGQAKFLEDAGADCIMVLPPFFLKPSADAIYDHVKAVADSVRLPVMVQYAPEQTGVAIPPEVWKRLAKECENLRYYKIECKPSGPYISSMMRDMEPKPGIFIGNCGYQMIEAFDRGAIGCMPCAAIVELYAALYRKYQAGDRPGAIAIHNDMLPLYNHIHQSVEMSIYYEKKIMKLRGVIESDYCRTPSVKPDKEMDDLFLLYYEGVKKYF